MKTFGSVYYLGVCIGSKYQAYTAQGLWHGTPINIANMQLAMFPCCGVVNMHRAGVWIWVILYSSSIHPQPDQVQITSDIAHFHAINGNHYGGGQTVFDVNCR